MAKKRSLTIIDNIKPKSAAFVYTPPPTFRTSLEKQRYWAEEKRKWIEGYSEDVNGFHYFYMTQCLIKIGTSGEVDRPKWRDCDGWILQDFAKAQELGYNHGLISRREIGKTSIGAGLLPNYFMRVYPGSTSLLTSCDKPRIFRMVNDKTLTVYDNLDKAIKGKVLNRNQTKDNVYLKVALSTLDKYGNPVTRESDIFCSETVENPSAFSSIRAKYGYYDEFPLHKRGNDLITSSDPCYKEGTRRTGTLMWAGTIEDRVDVETLKSLRTLVGDSKDSKTIITFAPYWWGIDDENVRSTNGHSNEKEARIWREKELERLSKLEDKTALRAFQKNYPASLEEALDTAIEGTLPKECMTIIAEQRRRIKTEAPPVMTYDLIDREETIEAVPNKKEGKFTILTLPEENKEYYGGIDPIPWNDAAIAKNSNYALIIYEYETDTPVAYYDERNLNSDIVCSNSILLQRFYNECEAMIERNVGGVTFEKYKDFGAYELLSKKPTTLGIKYTDKKITRGYFKNDKTSAIGNALLIKYILQYGHNIWFSKLLDQMEEFLISNTDLLDAFIACLMGLEDKTNKAVKAIPKVQYKEIPMVKRDAHGRTYVSWEKVNIAAQE